MLDDGDVPEWVRDEIGDSWQRSVTSGLHPDQFDVPYAADIDDDSRLVRAARPVVEGLIADLDRSPVSVVLTDHAGRLLERWVAHGGLTGRLDRIQLAPGFIYAEDRIGTNAIGTALAQRRSIWVDGEEHFADALVQMACAAVPLIDPQSGRALGVIDLTCRSEDGNPLLRTLALRTARDIEERLLDGAAVAARLALRRFLQARRGAKGPVVLVDGRRLIANAAADSLVGSDDAPALWDHARRHGCAGATGRMVTLDRGRQVRVAGCEPAVDGTATAGVIMRLERPEPARPGRGVVFGWDSLTSTELSVAVLVAEGLTNRQIGERLFMSRYTVDTHLRSVFRRLGISSRVELTGVVLERRGPHAPA